MALIDVSELMRDPDFSDAMTLIHRKAFVNSLGENVVSETVIQTIGSVQPASGKTLMRLPEALRVESLYSFWIKGEIVSDGTSAYPDVISFQGRRYQVKTIEDWMNWPTNNGWTEGVAVREVPAL